MEKRIFISHSSKDHETAEIICNALESNGMKCWIAPRDIPYGKEWAGEISKAITNSLAFLFLSSGNSNASGQVSREIQLALASEVPIIPIRLDGTEYSDTIKYYLATIHCMFQYDASKVAKLVSDIAKAVPKNDTDDGKDDKDGEDDKKPRYALKLILCGLWLLLCAAGATGAFFFTGLTDIIKYVIIAVAVIAGLLPLLIVRRKAIKSFMINRQTVNIILALSFAGAIGIGIGGMALDNYLWYSDTTDKYRITLTAPEDMTAGEFSAAAQIVEKRMDIIAGGEKYSIEVNGDEIELIVPFELFGELTATDMLKCYVSRACKLYLTTTLWNDEAPEIPQVEVTADDIESVKLLTGKIPGEPEVSEKDVLDTENYEYIEVTLKEDFVKANKEAIDSYGDIIVFAQDKVEISDAYYYFTTFTSDRDNVYYILNNDRHPSLNEVLMHNMTTEHSAYCLNVNVAVNALWEDVNTIDSPGKNQCNRKELEGDIVSISYRGSAYSDISEGKWLDTVASMKARLDALGQPYAFGFGVNDPYLIVVSTDAGKLNSGLLTTLCASRLRLTGGYSSISMPATYGTEKYLNVRNENGTPVLEVTAPDDSTKALFSHISAAAEKSVKERVYVIESDNNLPLLSAGADKKGKFVFDSNANGEKLDASESWLCELTLAVYENTLDVFLTLEQYSFEDDDRIFEATYLPETVKAEIEQIAKVRFIEDEGANLRIGLDLKVDENLPANMINTAKEIYEAVDFENTLYETISIYMISEQGEERARIFFAKYYTSLYGYEEEFKDGYAYTYGIFKGGRIERDKEVFLQLVNEDEFFSSLNHSADGNLFFE